MALTRVKYGVEYSTRREEPGGGSSGAGWIVVLVVLVASVSFIVHVVRRISASDDGSAAAGEEPALVVEALARTVEPSYPPVAETDAPPAVLPPVVEELPDEEMRPVVMKDFGGRPAKVKSLLLRLDQASANHELEKEVTTIEQLRALPGDAVADIDDKLVLKLGELNRRWLFEKHNPQWVAEVTVKRGDSATRLAQENGATLGSLRALNPGANLDRLRVGEKIKVMNHPSFALIIRRRLRTVDLHLNGKLFKRYTLPDSAPDIPLEPGAYRTPANLREYFRREGVGLTAEDAAEIDLLVPRDTPVRVSAS